MYQSKLSFLEKDTSLTSQAFQHLRQEILTCSLTPAQIVSECELARRNNFSKIPMRKALRQAYHDGFILRLPGRSYIISPIPIRDIRELYDLRLILECTAVERAVQITNSELLSRLKAKVEVKYDSDEPASHNSSLNKSILSP